MVKYRKLGYALSATMLLGTTMPLNVLATDVSDVLTFSDGASELSEYQVTYENGVTTLDIEVRFDGASIDKVLNQASGKGSTPGSFYATIDPHYGFTKPFAKGNFDYVQGSDSEPNTPEEFEQGFADQLDDCDAYYKQIFGQDFTCDSWDYWESNSSAFWQTYGYIQYKKNGVWVTAPSDKTNFASPTTAAQARPNRDRLVDALELADASELQYGVNWRFVGNGTNTAWIYRDTYPNPTRNEYIKTNISINYVFDYMTIDANGNPIYHTTLQDALNSEDATVILNKDTTVDTITIPAGKTLIEREGELTISDPLHSTVNGTYTKKDGKNYHIVKVTQTGAGLLQVAEPIVEVGSEVDLDIQIPDGYKISSFSIDGSNVSGDTRKFTMPNNDTSVIITFGEWTIAASPDESDDSGSDEVRGVIAESVTKDLKSLLESGETKNDSLTLSDLDKVKNVFKDGGSVLAYLEKWFYSSEDYYEYAEAYEAIVAQMEDGEKIAAMYDEYIDLYSSLDDSHLGIVYALDTPVKVRFEIPEEYRNVPAGFTRVFTIIRGHVDTNDVDTATRLATSRDGDDVVAENDKFSTFAIVYKDVVSTPDTGVMTAQSGSAIVASIVSAVAVGLITTITSLAYLLRRRQ